VLGYLRFAPVRRFAQIGFGAFARGSPSDVIRGDGEGMSGMAFPKSNSRRSSNNISAVVGMQAFFPEIGGDWFGYLRYASIAVKTAL
jgi:hypothetical protein